jgi:uncharacterized protein (TIGR03083 family)
MTDPAASTEQDDGTAGGAEALASLSAALEHAVQAMAELAAGLTPQEWSLPTRCPGWDVHDQVAHVASLEAQLLGGPVPPEAPSAPYIRNDFGAHMQRGVYSYRGVPHDDLIRAMYDVAQARSAALHADPPRPGMSFVGVMGNPVPVEQALPIRTFDVWAHEQDVRAAIGRPGDESGPAAEVSRDMITAMLPRHWGKAAAAEPGQSLLLQVTGSLPFELAVSVGEDGRAALCDPTDLGAAPTTVIEITWPDLVARACGRAGSEETAVAVSGDADRGRAVLDALPMTP